MVNKWRTLTFVLILANEMQRANAKWSKSYQFSQIAIAIESNQIKSNGTEVKVSMRLLLFSLNVK